MSESHDWNQQIIEEFRSNAGKVGGTFEGATILILHTTGARSGLPRAHPLVGQPLEDESIAVFASKAGAATNPDWYHNLLAHPVAAIELGTETVPVTARVAQGEERERIWSRQKERYPNFAEYEQKTTREIPVVVLERRS